MWRACHRAGNAAMRKIRPARVRKRKSSAPTRRKRKSKPRKM
jgi:hypothetical protein